MPHVQLVLVGRTRFLKVAYIQSTVISRIVLYVVDCRCMGGCVAGVYHVRRCVSMGLYGQRVYVVYVCVCE